jgi:hypothetical protein
MLWVAARYRDMPLVDIMRMMREWFDKRRCRPATFEYVISESGVLVRVEFHDRADALEFCKTFDGTMYAHRPSVKDAEALDVKTVVSG